MTTATTPKGRKVEVEVYAEHGTARLQSAKILYGGIAIGGYSQGGCKPNTLEEALAAADARIDANGLTDDTATMAVREVPEALRLMFRGKALQEGKTMQEKIIELMQVYVNN